MIIEDEETQAAPVSAPTEQTAYLETTTGADGFRYDNRGRVKFNKSTKKQRATEAADEVLQALTAADEDGARPKLGKRKQEKISLGGEFKAKVCFPFLQFA